jgi:hypothetical protein
MRFADRFKIACLMADEVIPFVAVDTLIDAYAARWNLDRANIAHLARSSEPFAANLRDIYHATLIEKYEDMLLNMFSHSTTNV